MLRNDAIAAALIGASRPEQIAENVKASGVELDEDAMNAIDAALAPVAVTIPPRRERLPQGASHPRPAWARVRGGSHRHTRAPRRSRGPARSFPTWPRSTPATRPPPSHQSASTAQRIASRSTWHTRRTGDALASPGPSPQRRDRVLPLRARLTVRHGALASLWHRAVGDRGAREADRLAQQRTKWGAGCSAPNARADQSTSVGPARPGHTACPARTALTVRPASPARQQILVRHREHRTRPAQCPGPRSPPPRPRVQAPGTPRPWSPRHRDHLGAGGRQVPRSGRRSSWVRLRRRASGSARSSTRIGVGHTTVVMSRPSAIIPDPDARAANMRRRCSRAIQWRTSRFVDTAVTASGCGGGCRR